MSPMMIRCASCGELFRWDPQGEMFVRLSVDIGWFTDSGGCPESIRTDGCCEECAERIASKLSEVLRGELQEPDKTTSQSKHFPRPGKETTEC